MFRKWGILVLGIISGAAVMYFFMPKNELSNNSEVKPLIIEDRTVTEVDYDTLYSKLLEEQQGKPKEKYWFDKKVEAIDQQAKQTTEEMQSAGDAAAKEFEKFAQPD